MPKVTDLNVRGRLVEVTVSQTGQFQATVGEGEERMVYTATTLDELETKLREAPAVGRVNVGFVYPGFGARGGKRGRIYKGHADGRSWMVESEGEKFREDKWHLRSALRLTDPEYEAYQAIRREEELAKKAREEFEENHRFNASTEAERVTGQRESR